MTQRIRFFVQWGFFAVFLTLTLTNRGQIWMGVIFLSIALAAIFGRYYCGWMCPIHTLIRPVKWLSQHLQLTKKKIPRLAQARYMRWIVLSLFLPLLGYTIYTITQGKKFPLPIVIIGFGVLTTFFINERTWHRYLCPWGTLLSATAKFSKFRLAAEGCKTCGLCVKNCPSQAAVLGKRQVSITSQYCLLCLKCRTACPASAISYQSRKDEATLSKDSITTMPGVSAHPPGPGQSPAPG